MYAEMALAGVTSVGEFHYLHHAPGGAPYADPNAMGRALSQAARDAGIRITLLDTCYLPGGLGAAATSRSTRSSGASATATSSWADAGPRPRRRAAARSDRRRHPLGRGPCPRRRRSAVVAAAAGPPAARAPVRAAGRERASAGALRPHPDRAAGRERRARPRTTAVHATHLTDADIAILGDAPGTAVLLPDHRAGSGRRDRTGPALADAGARLSLGSDQHAVIDLFEEARALEMDERLAPRERGRFTPASCSTRRHRHDSQLGWPDAGRLAAGRGRPGASASDTVRTAGIAPAQISLAATAADVDTVVGRRPAGRDRGGRTVLGDVGVLLADAIERPVGGLSDEPPDRRHRRAGHQRPRPGRRPARDPRRRRGGRRGATGRLGRPGRAAPPADSRVDVGGRSGDPGFVDSHTHLVFAGDRAAEFAARMAGAPYDGGGIASTVAGTRGRVGRRAAPPLAGRVAELRAQGTTRSRSRAATASPSRTRRASCDSPRIHATRPPFSAHTSCRPSADRADYLAPGLAATMLDACAPHCPLDRRLLRAGEPPRLRRRRGARGADRGRAAGLGLRVHGNQLAAGPGVRLAVELDAASVDHCTHLTDADIDALAGGDTVATLLPGVEFSTRSPYPDARRLLDAGVTVALATDCNPGTSFTSSMPFGIALAVREMGMTPGRRCGPPPRAGRRRCAAATSAPRGRRPRRLRCSTRRYPPRLPPRRPDRFGPWTITTAGAESGRTGRLTPPFPRNASCALRHRHMRHQPRTRSTHPGNR